ncbi:hypothetical protein D3C73_1455410 [compost metagenome]
MQIFIDHFLVIHNIDYILIAASITHDKPVNQITTDIRHNFNGQMKRSFLGVTFYQRLVLKCSRRFKNLHQLRNDM